MINQLAKNLAPFIEEELVLAAGARSNGNQAVEFSHLENAHVIGQESTYWHVKVHWLMLLWAIRNSSFKEFVGQVLRVFGAATKTAIGLVPPGNTGGANVSPFKVMPIDKRQMAIIQKAKAGL